MIATPEQPVADPPQGPRADAGGQVERRHAADARRALMRSLPPTRRAAAVPVALLLLAGGVLTVTEIVLARLGLPPLVAPRQRLARQIASLAFDDPAVTAGAALAALLGVLLLGVELARALFEGGVLGGDPLNGILCPFGFQIADAAKEHADASALGEDLGVGGLKRVLGVEGPLTPGRFT